MRFLLSLIILVMSFTASAGFEGFQSGTSLKLFNRINCSTGLTCTRGNNNLFTMTASNLGLKPQVVASATTITAAQCGSTFINAGAIEIELPEASAVLGCRLTFIVGNSTAFNIDPDAADTILIMTNAAGDRIVADLLGESVTLEAISATQWAAVSSPYGTWTDNN